MTRIKILDNPNRSRPNSDKSMPFATHPDEVIHYNTTIQVWCYNQSDIAQLFPTLFFSYKLSQNSYINFNVLSYSPHIAVCDCLLFYSNNLADKDLITEIIENNLEIPVKILISETNPFKFPLTYILTTPSLKDFYSEFFLQLSNIEKNLRRIFSEIDSDEDGFIDKQELVLGLSKLNFRIDADEISTQLKNLEIIKNGKIGYSEFSYWWKRGRQGGVSLKRLSETILSSINKVIPELEQYRSQDGIIKDKTKKTMKIESGNNSEGKLGILFSIGTGSKREEILRPVNNPLSLFIYESWVTFKLKYKNEALLKQNLIKIDEVVHSIKYTLLGMINLGNEMESGIVTKVINNGTEVFVCFIFDVQNDFVDELLRSLENLEKFFRSPTDDWVDVKFTSSRSLCEIDLNTDFISSVAEGSLAVNFDLWSMMPTLIKNSDSMFVSRLLKEENQDLAGLLKDRKSFRHYAKFFIEPLKKIVLVSPTAKKLFTSFEEEIIPEVSVYLRHSNIGVYFSITDPSLSSLFINVSNN